ncbi:nucleoporin NUP42-like [Homalodisca vitripennis]|uniref:nucleoporin NUP42-like n=1 Tax=Homalodisca vitripennis TaxID=197043 RepID=UPI001EEAA0BC|nr:nucleoporin NUP42-like [Homalodisca vitripennis]XP_046672328.1 nucleoporin NUP42-like [Homalodisca vitripennis]KAG8241971.1 Nucleoporin-like protein 2 [Homalodisca vitripennis]
MVVCKYFMEGYCKYGSRCKFEHLGPYDRRYDNQGNTDYSTGDRQTGISILKGGNTSFGNKEFENSFITQSNQQISFTQSVQVTSPGLKYNIQEIMQIILKDIAHLEKGSQWQLSSYCPLKDLTNMPGLEDQSPEELRWECYRALQNGTLPLYQAFVQQLYMQVAKMYNDLKKKETGYTIIERWLREGQASYAPTQNNLPPSLGQTGFTDAPQMFPPVNTQAVVNSSFSFALPQQEPAGVQTYQPGTSVFGGNQGQQLWSNSTPVDSSAYTPLEEVSERELEAFKAEKFVFGAIPIRPPPKDLCRI